jgi:transcriptional regulator with GAF, ATPase, and Fis domain
VLSFPLKLEEQPIGALNFYSSEKDAARPGQREEGMLFASQAAIAVANLRERASMESHSSILKKVSRTAR